MTRQVVFQLRATKVVLACTGHGVAMVYAIGEEVGWSAVWRSSVAFWVAGWVSGGFEKRLGMFGGSGQD